jgi:TonB family protein
VSLVRTEPNRVFLYCFIFALIFHSIILCFAISDRVGSDVSATNTIDVILVSKNNLQHNAQSKHKGLLNNSSEQINMLEQVANAKLTNQEITIEGNNYIGNTQPTNMIQTNSTISTTQDNNAAYIALIQDYLEDYGNKHYPIQLQDNNLRGKLQLLVAINSNGQLVDVKIQKSSGNQLLDETAKNLVKTAAPFQPFPEELSKSLTTLEIVRTWNFQG